MGIDTAFYFRHNRLTISSFAIPERIFFLLLILLFCSCKSNLNTSSVNVSVEHITRHKGNLLVNDTLLIDGTYYRESDSFDSRKEMLYHDLLVGDLMFSNDLKTQVSRIRASDTTVFFKYPLNLPTKERPFSLWHLIERSNLYI